METKPKKRSYLDAHKDRIEELSQKGVGVASLKIVIVALIAAALNAAEPMDANNTNTTAEQHPGLGKKILSAVVSPLDILFGKVWEIPAGHRDKIATPEQATWSVVGSLDGKTPGFGLATAITDKYMATCAHFWKEDDPRPEVVLIKIDAEGRQAKVVYRDYKNDLAILEVAEKFKNNEQVWLEDESPLKGSKMKVLASTFGDANAKAAQLEVVDINDTSLLLKTSDTIGHGHSGGGIFNSKGEVSGVLTHGTRDGKIAVAVSAEQIKIAIGKLANYKASGRIFNESNSVEE